MSEIKMINSDYCDVIPEFKKNQFDWLIADPPYYDVNKRLNYHKSVRSSKKTGAISGKYSKNQNWDVPGFDYLDSMKMITKNQIIWGINYFEFASSFSGRIVWDKCNSNTDYSDCEIAGISSINVVRLFRYVWNGMLQGKSIKYGHITQGNNSKLEKRIHPTQKPVNLYLWILQKFTKPGEWVLDTHGGSGSLVIACHILNRNIIYIEKDLNTYNDAKKRVDAHLLSYNQNPTLNFK